MLEAHVLYGSRAKISKFALSRIVFAIILRPPAKIKLGMFDILLPMSYTNSFKLLKGLSKTAAYISL